MTRGRAAGKPRSSAVSRSFDGSDAARDKPGMSTIARRLCAIAWCMTLGLPRTGHASDPIPPDVEHLCPAAATGLAALRQAVPSVVVTSGVRDRQREARAWADNIARRRTWMRILRAHDRPELIAAQAWIDQHWRALRGHPEPIGDHLEAVFATLDDATMAELSPHVAGRALDLRKSSRVTRGLLRRLPSVSAVLDEHDHWHVSFDCR